MGIKKQLTIALSGIALLMGLTFKARAQGTIKGRVYADYYAIGSHHNESLEG